MVIIKNLIICSMNLQVSPWDRNELTGFRCIKYIDDTLKQQLTRNFNFAYRDYSNLQPVPDEIFQVYKKLFEFKGADLNPTVTSKSETEDWIQEIISIDVPYEDAPLKILLFLPVNYKPPYQSIVYVPGLGVVYSSTVDDMNVEGGVDFFLKSGRAVIWPVYYSIYGRGEIRPINLYTWKQVHKNIMTDFQIVCDYLQTRNDIDSERMAYYGLSWGGALATYILAIEERIKLGILALFGIQSIEKYGF